MASLKSSACKRIDAALADYYLNLGYSDYIDQQTGTSKFMQYIIDEKLDEDVAIERELGDNCDSNHCTYSWINNSAEFPVPSYVNISNDLQKEAFIFYVIQYCYKYGQHPSEYHIRSTLVPQSMVSHCNSQQTESAVQNSQDYRSTMHRNDSYESKEEPQDVQYSMEEVSIRKAEDDGIDGPIWLDQLIDIVLQEYDVIDFNGTSIGAKSNIRIGKEDLDKIDWNNLDIIKCKSPNNKPPNSETITISIHAMSEYCNITLTRLRRDNYIENNLIPIMVMDEHNNYGIEWVLIVRIIHKDCNVGISFRYDIKTNIFIATAIYLDKDDIESKHKLIGLKYNYCQHLAHFSLENLILTIADDCSEDSDDEQQTSYKTQYVYQAFYNMILEKTIETEEQKYKEMIKAEKKKQEQIIDKILAFLYPTGK